MNKMQPKTFWVSSGNPEYVELMTKAGFKQTSSLVVADIVVFTGGSDVDPMLYGEERLPTTGFSLARDKEDTVVWRCAKDKIKVGICRGGQFLNVMNGGKLWQHVNRHTQDHVLTDEFTGRTVNVSSTHHQMFRPARGAIVIATARETTLKIADKQRWSLKDDGSKIDDYFKKDFEVVYYPRTKSLCFQPHPEFREHLECRDYFYSVLRRVLDGTIEAEEEQRLFHSGKG